MRAQLNLLLLQILNVSLKVNLITAHGIKLELGPHILKVSS